MKSSRGFTLIELLIVVVILAVLAAIVIPKFSNNVVRSKEAALHEDLRVVRNAIAVYRADTHYCPIQWGDLTATAAPAQGVDETGTLHAIDPNDWHGPYMQGAQPKDPVSGNDFLAGLDPVTGIYARSSASGNDSNNVPYSSY